MLKNKGKSRNDSMEKVFSKQLNRASGVKFSKNAVHRLLISESKLSGDDLERLKLGLKKAAQKGSRVSLILVNNIAYIVSVKNSTVITALSDYSAEKRVVDKIDSIVFM